MTRAQREMILTKVMVERAARTLAAQHGIDPDAIFIEGDWTNPANKRYPAWADFADRAKSILIAALDQPTG